MQKTHIVITIFMLLSSEMLTVADCDEHKKVIIQGDVYLAGLFQIMDTKNGICNGPQISYVQTLEAVKWTLEMLNQYNYIPGTKLGLIAFATCGLTTEANNDTFELITDLRTELYNHEYSGDNYQPVAGIIGPPFSEEVQSTSRIISTLPDNEQFTQIGYSATATSLENKTIYKNFVSVIPGDDIQIRAMVSLMKKLKWNYIAVLFEDDIYGREGANHLQNKAKDNDICIVYSSAIKVSRRHGISANDLAKIVETLILTYKIKGVVFFVGSFVAQKLLKAVKTSGYTEKITFIFSEGISLKEEVFLDNGNFIEKAEGSFIMTPPEIIVDSFKQHWDKIFQNVSYLLHESEKNPWLIDVFENFHDCTIKGKTCFGILRNKQYRQVLHTGYAIKSALVFASVLKAFHEEICGLQNISSYCEEFKETILRDKKKIMTALFDTVDTFQNFTFPPPLEQYFKQTIQHLSENHLNGSTTEMSLYEVHQFNKCSDRQNDYCFKKIGQYKNNKLTLGSTWNNIPEIAECPIGKKCSKCQHDKPAELVYFREGDIYVVGVVPVYHKLNGNPMGCDHIKKAHSVELAEVMAFAVQTVNNDKNYFPNKTVGIIVLNSCNQRLVIQRKILDLLERGILQFNGTYLNVTGKIMGFIGGFSSTVTIAMADILTELKYVQISYAGTSTVLTDRKQYPYFLRVVPPNNNEGKVMIEILDRLKDSSYVQVLYSEGAFGESCNAAFEIETKNKSICIANQIAVIEDKYSGILDELRKNHHAKIVVAFLQSYMAVGVAKEIQSKMSEGEFMIMGSQALGQTPEIIVNNNKLVGSLTLSYGMNDIPGFNEYFKNITMEKSVNNPWLRDYLEEKHQCYLDGSFNKIFRRKCTNDLAKMTEVYTQEQWTPYAYSAVMSFLQGANDTIYQLCGWRTKSLCTEFKDKPKFLWENIKKQRLNVYGRDTPESLYDSNGDGKAVYTIYNIQKSKEDSSKMEYVKVGYTNPDDRSLNFNLEVDKLIYAENLQLPSKCPNDVVCRKCFGDKVSLEHTEVNPANNGLIAGIVLLLVLLVVLTGLLIFKLRGRKENIDETYIHPDHDSGLYVTMDVGISNCYSTPCESLN